MSEKAELKKDHGRMELLVEGYTCSACMEDFSIYLRCFEKPNYCPCCGVEFITEKTPFSIVEEIKSIYHSTPRPYGRPDDEDKMEKLLYELRDMAEGKK